MLKSGGREGIPKMMRSDDASTHAYLYACSSPEIGMPDLPRVFWSIPDLTDIPWFLEPWRPPLFTKLFVRTGFRKEDL
jgi:hypothetical protein